jgi:hypothetical protein
MFDSYLQVSSKEDGDRLHGAGRSDRSGERLMPYRNRKVGLVLFFAAVAPQSCCFTASGTLSASRVASNWASAALVNKRKGSGRGFHVVGAEPLDPKSARFNQVVNLSVKMATAAEPFPRWC